MSELTIDVLFTRECPHLKMTERELDRALDKSGLDEAEVNFIEIETQEDAVEMGFVGSPTVRVNGLDVQADATGEGPAKDVCREYPGEGGKTVPYPPADLILRAIEESRDRVGTPER